MKRQKICIIGGGLTGLLTAVTLSKINLEIDIISDNPKKKINSNRTVAISQENLNFLKKLNLPKLKENLFWPSLKMKLYSYNEEKIFSEIFNLKSEKEKKILYVADNFRIIKDLLNNIKNNKLVNFKTKKKVSNIYNGRFLKSIRFKNKINDKSKYNLVIVCVGRNLKLINSLFGDNFLKKSYNEISATTKLKHSSLKNSVVRQIFLKNGTLAFLPLSKTKTSIVFSLKKESIPIDKDKVTFFKKEIFFYANNFYKKIKFCSNIEFADLNLLIGKKYYSNRTLLFGDSLHAVHPFAGQGLNMTLRDLKNLQKVLKERVNLGLDVGTEDVLHKFTKLVKSKNFVYSLGIDFLRNIFMVKNKNFRYFRNKVIGEINKKNIYKSKFFDIANKGI
tara:strand:- start:459 stop:1631 length:1173 start_codon:yes stop_codon:yes gene_type:complete